VLKPPIVVMPMLTLNKIVRSGLEFAINLSPEVHVVHVDVNDDREAILAQWKEIVEEPLRVACIKVPELTILDSPYRLIINPVVDFALDLAKKNPDRKIAVIIPELVEKHWYMNFLHNQRSTWLKAALLLRGTDRIVVINVPWYLN
jgi:hypothetical protein